MHLFENVRKITKFLNAETQRGDLQMMLQFAQGGMPFISPTKNHILYVCDAV